MVNGPNPITSFQPNGAWMTYWDTSDLIHDQQYELQVKAYDGIDYSVVETVRIVIDNPADADNIAPTFNSTNWVDTYTIFCDESSSSFDRCAMVLKSISRLLYRCRWRWRPNKSHGV